MTCADDVDARTIAEFRANHGRVGRPFEGAPLLLLHTIGARSGTAQVNPDDASLSGLPFSPARVAVVHHVSLRRPYRTMSVDGVSVGSYIRRRRLEGCRTELDRESCPT